MDATIVARLTPPGKSAIACLGIAGPRSWNVVRVHFQRPNKQPLPDAPTGRTTFFGSFGDAAAGSDQVVLFVRQIEPHVVVEIHCHGGPEVLRMLEGLLAASGAEVVSPDAWLTALNGTDRAEMIAILTRCPTARTAALALEQLDGAFERACVEIDSLLSVGKSREAAARRQRLIDLIPVGEHLARPWKVAIAGEPNVGKSSLVNALAGYTRSIVAPTPGTTRDVVAAAIALDGWPIELVDTAGLRNADDPLEAEGIARAAAAHAGADLVLWVLDATVPAPTPPTDALVVINKIDCPAAWDLNSVQEAVRTSALNREGIDRLAAAIVRRLVPEPPTPGEAVPATLFQRMAVCSW